MNFNCDKKSKTCTAIVDTNVFKHFISIFVHLWTYIQRHAQIQKTSCATIFKQLIPKCIQFILFEKELNIALNEARKEFDCKENENGTECKCVEELRKRFLMYILKQLAVSCGNIILKRTPEKEELLKNLDEELRRCIKDKESRKQIIDEINQELKEEVDIDIVVTSLDKTSNVRNKKKILILTLDNSLCEVISEIFERCRVNEANNSIVKNNLIEIVKCVGSCCMCD